MKMNTNGIRESLPRHVPLTLCLQALFGSMTSMIGWFVFGFSLAFVWLITLRFHGLRFADIGWPLLLVFFFLAGGLLLMILEIRKGLRAIHVMRHGLPALATLISVSFTGSQYGRRGLIFRMTFRFSAGDAQQYTVSCATYAMKPAWSSFYNVASVTNDASATQYVEKLPNSAELQEVVLYDPANPAFALVPVDIGPALHADAQGHLCGINPLHGITACLIPLLVIAGHGWYLIHLLGH